MTSLARASMMILLLSTASAAAQERMRSSDYSGETSVEGCYEWETGFEFSNCERLPLPADPNTFGQTYTLTDGTRRTLTADPRAGGSTINGGALQDAATMAADSIVAGLDQGDDNSSVEASVLEDSDADLERLNHEIEAATQARAGVSEEVQQAIEQAQSSTGIEVDDDTLADDEDSKIIEKDFVLPSIVATIPGRAEIMPMATGHMNRIETPFKDPMVRTSADASAATFEFDQNFIYVTVTQPSTLFIHENGHPDPVIVVSLVPQRIAPRQVKITVPPSMQEAIKKNGAAAAAARSGEKPRAATGPAANSRGVRRATPPKEATNTVAHMVQAFAQGRMPKGFVPITLEGFQTDTFCQGGNVRYSFTQGRAVASNEYIIVRGMAQSSSQVEMDERWCARHPETLAVAFTPRTIINKDNPTDFVVIIHRPNATLKVAR